MCLGKEFSSSGFLHSSLFMLLENLICSDFKVKSASDAVLHIMTAILDYPTVSRTLHFAIFVDSLLLAYNI